jgi:cytochrome oxidase assembly protein ShyY1
MRFFAPKELVRSAIALLLCLGCLWASQWQYYRGSNQTHQNATIRNNQKLPPITETQLTHADPIALQWRIVELHGNFLPNHQLLIRDRYFQGVYGFEVLTLFHSPIAGDYWLDRGWVKAGATAATPPNVPAANTNLITVTARIRSENLNKQIQGSFFALPHSSSYTFSIAHAQGVSAAPFYLDLVSATPASAGPINAIELPDLSDGPHYAYAIQWLAFGLLILVGRGMLYRQVN